MRLDPSRVDRVIIHTAAAATTERVKTLFGWRNRLVPVDQPLSVVRDYHMRPKAEGGKGWSDVGYNEYVRFDGTVEIGRGYDTVGAHVEGFNSRSYGICGSGHGDVAPFANDQLWAMVWRTVSALEHFGLAARFKENPMVVMGHREVNLLIDSGRPEYSAIPRVYKTCPGAKNDMRKFRKAVAAEIKRRGL